MDYNVEKIFPNHFMLSYKNKGASKALVGEVGFYFFLISDLESKWDTRSIKKFENSIVKAILLLEKQAKNYGIDLDIKYAKEVISIGEKIQRENWRTALYKAIGKYSFKTVDEFQEYYEKKYKLNDSCVILVFNKDHRSYASVASSKRPKTTECSIIGKEKGFITSAFSHTTIMHEILHQFGAQDYYYPASVQKNAQLYIKNSIMLWSDHETIDTLTAYLIGWTTHIDKTTERFLKSIYTITQDAIDDATNDEWKNN